MTLSPRIQRELENLHQRHEDLSAMLSDSEIIGDRARFTALSKEFAELEPVAEAYGLYDRTSRELTDSLALASDDDAEMRAMANSDAETLKEKLEQIEQRLNVLLLPRDPNDHANVFLEVRAGTGGEEAALFAGDLFRMYCQFAKNQGWEIEILSEREGEKGGYKEVISRIEGQDVYAQLKFESGAHRVQRVPETEASGRIHTSACTVAILPEADEIDDIDIDKGDLRIDTYRASGAGGQHVNKTDSAVRIVHLPSGIVVECQDERSQHKNRARAMSLLHAKLLDQARTSQTAKQAAQRKSLVGSGDRSERIRTYNFQQGRVTDHRINLTLYALNEVLAGDLNRVIEPLMQEHQASLLTDLAED